VLARNRRLAEERKEQEDGSRKGSARSITQTCASVEDDDMTASRELMLERTQYMLMMIVGGADREQARTCLDKEDRQSGCGRRGSHIDPNEFW